jgi:photosynthetic reaction center H subunit
VDTAEPQIRYLEIETASGLTLLPINFVRMSRDGERVLVKSIRSDQFASVPGIASMDQITLQEEDKICAYYGGGHLYATPERAEPLI